MTNGRKSFLSKGDKLLKINDMDLRDLPPELFAELLAESSPRLTVYQPHTDAPKDKCPENGGFRPFSKEDMVLSFSLDLRREADPDDVTKENFHEAAKPESQLDKLLLVTMISTSFSIITGRGCDKEGFCQDEFCTQCYLNDVIMEAKSSNITQVLREIAFIQEKVQDNIFIQSLMYEKYIQNRQRFARMSSNCMTNSVNITIYYYKTTCIEGEYRGIPVVLNFSGTDCYLKCSKTGDEPTVSIESCEKNKLKNVHEGDKDIVGFLFYMKAVQPDMRRFESVGCSGWYLHAKKEEVEVERFVMADEAFYFFIEGK